MRMPEAGRFYSRNSLKNLNDFGTMNKIYAEYFKSAPPARATIEASRLPRDVLVEIAVIATK